LQVDEKTRPVTRAGRVQQPTSATEGEGWVQNSVENSDRFLTNTSYSKLGTLWRTWGLHCGVLEEWGFLKCDDVPLTVWFPTFRKHRSKDLKLLARRSVTYESKLLLGVPVLYLKVIKFPWCVNLWQ